jgi:hypothetical protein
MPLTYEQQAEIIDRGEGVLVNGNIYTSANKDQLPKDGQDAASVPVPPSATQGGGGNAEGAAGKTPDQNAAIGETGGTVGGTDNGSSSSSTPSAVDTAKQKLAAAGYDTDDKIRDASDEDLLKVEGIGPATLQKVRDSIA